MSERLRKQKNRKPDRRQITDKDETKALRGNVTTASDLHQVIEFIHSLQEVDSFGVAKAQNTLKGTKEKND